MSFTEIFRKGAVALSALSLLFVVSCGKDDSKKDNPEKTSAVEDSSTEKNESAASTSTKDSIYAETVADCTWEEDKDKTSFLFKVNFIAEEGEGVDGGEFGGKPFKNRPIELYTVDFVSKLKRCKGYKPGMKPVKHQKVKIKYEKTYPYMVGFLEYFKYQDEQGNVIELE